MMYFLYGPPASGKTTIGRMLAERLRVPFRDLDQEIETRAGMTLPRIFDRYGEAGLRAQERLALETTLARGAGVVALGGGALLDRELRSRVEAAGRVLCLSASLHTLACRLESQAVDRPLMRGDNRERLAELLASRDGHYRSFALRVSTEGRSPEQSAWEAQLRLGAFHLRGMGEGCDVRVQSGGIGSLARLMRERDLHGPVVVATDSNVGPLYVPACRRNLRQCSFRVGVVTLPSGERYKVIAQVVRLWQAFRRAGLERGSTVLALGGGVIGDLAGFAAATYLRGLAWVNAPTTLLAMIDAGFGGKTAINLGKAKNQVGAFHSPRLVLADPEALATLPDVELRSGLAEVVKHGVIGDPGLLDMVAAGLEGFKAHAAEAIPRAMAVKLRIVEADPHERGLRAVLNFGHTVGHGLEVASRYSLRHGEAVAIGMVVEGRIADSIGLAPRDLARSLAEILGRNGLPTEIPKSIDRLAVVRAMTLDKKRRDGRVRFALPVDFGKVEAAVEVEGWQDWILTC